MYLDSFSPRKMHPIRAKKTLCAHTLKVIQFNHVQHSALKSKGLELALCKQNWPRPDKRKKLNINTAESFKQCAQR